MLRLTENAADRLACRNLQRYGHVQRTRDGKWLRRCKTGRNREEGKDDDHGSRE